MDFGRISGTNSAATEGVLRSAGGLRQRREIKQTRPYASRRTHIQKTSSTRAISRSRDARDARDRERLHLASTVARRHQGFVRADRKNATHSPGVAPRPTYFAHGHMTASRQHAAPRAQRRVEADDVDGDARLHPVPQPMSRTRGFSIDGHVAREKERAGRERPALLEGDVVILSRLAERPVGPVRLATCRPHV